MNWKIKSLGHQILSRAPQAETLNYFLQRHVTGALPVCDETFVQRVKSARRHFDAFRELKGPGFRLDQARFYEFGAGWDLITALTFYYLGVSDQTVVDIKPLLKLELVDDSLRKFRKLRDRLNLRLLREPGDNGALPRLNGVQYLAREFGIKYFAPADVGSVAFQEEGFDFVSSTDTLEHVPPQQIPPLLSGCYRLLKKGGLMSSLIDYRDHYSHYDKRVSAYNFLRYSHEQWKRYNPRLQYQNRLRHKDYIELSGRTRFE
ncbi:MAG: class I SAM-dependent methyltransferase, partial [Candidatus Krumholzibacteriia bacterium]